MSDFSLFALFTAGLACFAPLTAAYTQPVGDSPSGNPFSQPGLNSVVPAGKDFVVTWDPTTQGTVTIVLLKGPSTNAVPQYAIVEKIDNTGTYTWHVASDLAPSPADTPAQGYGLQLIVDATGQYQYTTQFGISNPDYKEASSSSSSSSSASATATESAKSTKSAGTYGSKSSSASTDVTTTVHYTKYTTYCPEPTTISMHNQTYTVSKGTNTITVPAVPVSPVAPKGTGNAPVYSAHNVTMVAPTGYVPKSTLATSAATASNTAAAPTNGTGAPSSYTGAASHVAGGVFGAVFAAGVAILAF